eukprot:CAMPEP_0115511858 /NCGR_PEP_ID=MMETSP0271-20121206/74194_1 /TAXON_ID=71861 /ORGANISM="Scrippsiella trochoidea, Strain CCMP3099" /LENGTH=396 /DNA_ID=CAMNT_0002941965 /DNA_START=54 /DNA_END=1244 /DNA_ORIENTATION=-
MAEASVVVVGGGFAGLSAAISALEAGASSVTLLEKEPKLGGNSAKASFGINAVGEGDTVDAFVEDALAAGGPSADSGLVRTLARHSMESLQWLQTFGLSFDEVAHGAGSRVPRKVVKLIAGAAGVRGVRYERGGVEFEAFGAVVICSGGFGASVALLPETMRSLPTTQGPWTLGEVAQMASVAGASLVDMDKVQLHPTGFVDPKDVSSQHKILASEALRQAGAVLIDGMGHRFCQEKDDVSSKIMAKLGQGSSKGATCQQPLPIRLVLPPKVAESQAKHLGFYCSKGLLVKYNSIPEMANALGLDTRGIADAIGPDVVDGAVLCGEVAPAVHYCLGGIKINDDASAVGEDGPIPGLFAAGEVTGGIHGLNRIAGNGLLESVVFGRIAGKNAVEFGI